MGESTCLSMSALRSHIYITCPNGIETTALLILSTFFIYFLYYMGYSLFCPSLSGIIWSILLILFFESSFHSSHIIKRASYENKFPMTIIVTILGAWIVLSQEMARAVAHIRQKSYSNLFWRFDWMCGKNPTYVKSKTTLINLRFGLYIIVIVLSQILNINKDYDIGLLLYSFTYSNQNGSSNFDL